MAAMDLGGRLVCLEPELLTELENERRFSLVGGLEEVFETGRWGRAPIVEDVIPERLPVLRLLASGEVALDVITRVVG